MTTRAPGAENFQRPSPQRRIVTRREAKSAGLQDWHVWHVLIPRRTITGRLVYGRVWRRRDGRRWIYKRYVDDRG